MPLNVYDKKRLQNGRTTNKQTLYVLLLSMRSTPESGQARQQMPTVKDEKKNGRTTSFAHKLLGATPELRTTYHPLPINTHNKIEREYRQRQYGMVGTYAVCSLVAWMTAHEKCVLCINLSNLSVFFNIDANICGYKVDSRKYMVHSAVANNRQDMYSHFAHRSPNEVELALTPKI